MHITNEIDDHMQVFAVFDVSMPDRVKSRLDEKFPDDYFQSGHSTFFVATTGKTTRQMAHEIGVENRGDGRAVIVPVSSYWGVHNSDLWEWISVKMTQND